MVAVALGLAALIVAYRRSADQPARGATIRSLAVLPLTNLSGNSAQQFFTDGMTEAIIDHLSALQGVRVIANFRYAVRGNS
jgi:TolB-like protein